MTRTDGITLLALLVHFVIVFGLTWYLYKHPDSRLKERNATWLVIGSGLTYVLIFYLLFVLRKELKQEKQKP